MSMSTGALAIAVIVLVALIAAAMWSLVGLVEDLFEDLGGRFREREPDPECQDDFHAAMHRKIARDKALKQ